MNRTTTPVLVDEIANLFPSKDENGNGYEFTKVGNAVIVAYRFDSAFITRFGTRATYEVQTTKMHDAMRVLETFGFTCGLSPMNTLSVLKREVSA